MKLVFAASFVLCACAHESYARHAAIAAAQSDWSCPQHRLAASESATPQGAPAPRADIASDPERLAFWRQSHAPPEHRDRDFVVSGCGKSATYRCTWVSVASAESFESYGCVAAPVPSPRGADALAELTRLKDESCACKGASCAERSGAALEAWLAAHRDALASGGDDARLAQGAAALELTKRIVDCVRSAKSATP
ncbi:MAG TPA: hypothetical protein VGH28_32615 [Polyangiaceae bacterium]|jgi:hypothetical protein